MPRLAASASTRMHGAADKCPKGVIRVHVRGIDNLTGVIYWSKHASSFQLFIVKLVENAIFPQTWKGFTAASHR